LYRKAVDQGDRLAPEILAEIYEKGVGVPKDLAEAKKWYRKAAEVSVLRAPAEQGFANMQYLIGELYYKGEAYPEALAWYRKAAAQGDSSSQFMIGSMYANGEGLKKNLDEARKFYRLSAEGGGSLGPTFLGLMYAEGDGVPKDATEAYAWLNIASAKGNSMAKRELAGLERTMSAPQVHQAQERTKELAKELSGEIRDLKELRDIIEREKKGA
jgi:hypothetical protein